jgi:CheY-like chemotaxis protein
MANEQSFPTILVAEADDVLQSTLAQELRQEGYFVLVARDEPEAVEIARLHSRPIHILLTVESRDGRMLAATLKQYRPNMRSLFITRRADYEADDLLRSESALLKVKELLKPPGNLGHELTEPRRGKTLSHGA